MYKQTSSLFEILQGSVDISCVDHLADSDPRGATAGRPRRIYIGARTLYRGANFRRLKHIKDYNIVYAFNTRDSITSPYSERFKGL